jgi:hypothetical protein
MVQFVLPYACMHACMHACNQEYEEEGSFAADDAVAQALMLPFRDVQRKCLSFEYTLLAASFKRAFKISLVYPCVNAVLDSPVHRQSCMVGSAFFAIGVII